jgi:hypothetical protein
MKSLLFAGILSLSVFFAPLSAKALVTGVPFGGFVTSVIPCTCPPFGLWIQYTPFFFGSSIPAAGALYFPIGALLYEYFQIGVPGTWELGSFIPNPGQCLILAPTLPPSCIPLPALGTIEYTGTSSLVPMPFKF